MRAIGIIGKGTVLACLVGLCVIAGRAEAAGPSPEYLALLEAARAEGKATIGGFAFDPEEIATLEKGFKKRFGFPIKLTHDPTHIRDLPPKVIAKGFDVVELNVAGGHQVRESPQGLAQVEWSMFATSFRSWTRSIASGRRRIRHACSISMPSLAWYTIPNW